MYLYFSVSVLKKKLFQKIIKQGLWILLILFTRWKLSYIAQLIHIYYFKPESVGEIAKNIAVI